MHRVLAAGLVAVLALSLVPSAQAQDATLSGQVLDQDGSPVPGASVRLSQWGETDEDFAEECAPDGTCRQMPGPSTYHEAGATTDADGRFELAAWDRHGTVSVWKEGHAEAYVHFDDASQPVVVELLKFPDKTAHIQGTVRGGSGGLPYASISIENPQYGIYECSSRSGEPDPVMDGNASDGGGSAGHEGEKVSSDGGTSYVTVAPDEPYWSGCAITINEDGTFDGMVTPGYSIIRFSHDDWRHDGPQYYTISRVMDLPADETTQIDVQLTARPGPDAVLAGHVIDKATQQGIPGAQVSFSSQDAHGWANAQTDKDGSYKVALRSGFTQIHVWADGYLPWEGQVTLRASSDGQRFTIELTEGQARWGGCCYAMEAGYAMDGEAMASDAPAKDSSDDRTSGEMEEQSAAFQDLGGGLGPFDASADNASGAEAQGVPGFEIVALALGLLAVVVLRRR